MAKSPTKPDQAQLDNLPELDDDVEVEAAAPETVADDVAEAAPDESAKREKYDPRAEAVRRYRELRDRGVEAASEADEEQAEAEPAEPPAQKAEAAPPAKQEPVAEAKPDPVLEEMRQMLAESRRLLEQATAKPAAPAAEPEPVAEAAAAEEASEVEISAERFKDIVSRVQIGDAEEGAEALAEYAREMIALTRKANPGTSPTDISSAVTQQLQRERSQAELAGAADTFKGKYEGIVNDPELLDISFRRLDGELRKDLIEAGVDKDVVAKMDQNAVMANHQTARMRGAKVRAYGDIFDKVGNDMVGRYGAVLGPQGEQPARQTQKSAQPPPPRASEQINDRLDRKRAAAVQPRAVGARATAESSQKPKTRRDVLNEMRKARGFAN